MKEFDWDKFKGNEEMCVHCQTEDEANEFCKMMDVHGMKWNDGRSYLDDTEHDTHKENTVYYGDGTYGSAGYAKLRVNTIIEFSDYFTTNTGKINYSDKKALKTKSAANVTKEITETKSANLDVSDIDITPEDVYMIIIRYKDEKNNTFYKTGKCKTPFTTTNLGRAKAELGHIRKREASYVDLSYLVKVTFFKTMVFPNEKLKGEM